MKENPFMTVTVPMDSSWGKQAVVKTWEARSVFEQKLDDEGETLLWHLHPELVDSTEDGIGESALLCSRCTAAVQKGDVPKLSIKAGIDLGWSARLGLTEPNLTEQLILARNRLYYTAIKICSNTGTTGQDFDRRALGRLHAVLFPHDAPEVASRVTQSQLFVPEGLLDENRIREFLQIFFCHRQRRK